MGNLNCASINTNDIDEYKINRTSVVESQGQNEANSTVEALVTAEVSKVPEIYQGSEPVFDEISDESEPETLYPPLHQIEGPLESDRPITFCRLASTGYNFSQYPSLEASKHEQTEKIQPSSEDDFSPNTGFEAFKPENLAVITITNNKS